MNALIPDPLDSFVGLPILQQKAGAIRALAKNVARDIVEIGRHLTEAKAACAHGEWLPWLESEFGWSSSAAARYMAIYDAVSTGNFPSGGNLPELPIKTLAALASPNIPQEVRQEVIARAESGETLSRAEVDALIAKAKAEAEEAKAQAEAKVKDAREVAQRDRMPIAAH